MNEIKKIVNSYNIVSKENAFRHLSENLKERFLDYVNSIKPYSRSLGNSKKLVFGNEECNNKILKIKIIDIYNIIEEILNSLINEKKLLEFILYKNNSIINNIIVFENEDFIKILNENFNENDRFENLSKYSKDFLSDFIEKNLYKNDDELNQIRSDFESNLEKYKYSIKIMEYLKNIFMSNKYIEKVIVSNLGIESQ